MTKKQFPVGMSTDVLFIFLVLNKNVEKREKSLWNMYNVKEIFPHNLGHNIVEIYIVKLNSLYKNLYIRVSLQVAQRRKT